MGKRPLVPNHKRVARFRRTSRAENILTFKRLTSSTSDKTENYFSRKIIRAFVRSYGESSTETLSPGTMRMKCLRILPEICARTLRWPGRSTRNIVPGKTCVTVPSVMICSSFAIAPLIYAPAHVAQDDGTRPVRRNYPRRDLAELFQRKRWQVFAKLLTFPPSAGLAKLVHGCKTIAIK